jgi:hypothetical protein
LLATIGIIKAPAKAAQFEYKYAHNLPTGTPLHIQDAGRIQRRGGVS